MQSCFSRRIRGFIRYYPLAYPPDPHPGTFPACAELTGQALPRWYDFGVWGWGCSPCHPSVSFGFPPPPWVLGQGVWGCWCCPPPACGLGRGGPRCLRSLALSCIQITAVPWPSCGDIPACPGDSPGDASTCYRGLFLASEAKEGSRIPRGVRGWFPWMVFSGWFLCKTSPMDAPAKAAFPGSQLGQAENGGLLAVWGEPLRPLLPARLWLWAWRVLGAVLPSSSEIPPEAGGGLWTMPSSISH